MHVFGRDIQVERSPTVAVAAAIGMLLLAIPTVFAPTMRRMSLERVTLKELCARIDNAQKLAINRQSEQQTLQAAQERHQALEKRIGEGQSVARVLETLTRQAKDWRLELTAVQPRADVGLQQTTAIGPDIRLRQVPLMLEVTGRYRQLGEFLDDLAQGPYLVSVRKLTIVEQERAEGHLKANIVLVLFLSARSS